VLHLKALNQENERNTLLYFIFNLLYRGFGTDDGTGSRPFNKADQSQEY
jgi:hypothetical protein